METFFHDVIGPLWGEFTGHRWISFTKASDVELWCFLCTLNKRLSQQSWGWWFESPSRPLLRHCNVSCFSVHPGITIGVLSILLNILFLLAMRYLKDQTAAYHHFMRNLSLADVLASCSFLLITSWPQMAQATMSTEPNLRLIRILSYVLRSLPWVFFTAYLLTLTCLTMNQFLAVCRPWKYSSLVTPRMVTVSLVIIWLLAAFQMLIPLVISITLYGHTNNEVFNAKLAIISNVEMQVWMSLFAMSLIFNILLNIIIYQKIRQLKLKRRHSHSPGNPESMNIRMKQEVFLTVVLLLITSIFCRLPFPLVGIFGMNFPSRLIDAGIILLLYLNFFVDPIIYFMRMKEVRKTYRLMFSSCARCVPSCFELNEDKYLTRSLSVRAPSVRTEISNNAGNEYMHIETVSLQQMTVVTPDAETGPVSSLWTYLPLQCGHISVMASQTTKNVTVLFNNSFTLAPMKTLNLRIIGPLSGL